jgi:hypothetical protein
MTEHTTQPKIGDKMPDGTIYAGISPDTGKAHVPTKNELSVLFNTPASRPTPATRCTPFRDPSISRARWQLKERDFLSCPISMIGRISRL